MPTKTPRLDPKLALVVPLAWPLTKGAICSIVMFAPNSAIYQGSSTVALLVAQSLLPNDSAMRFFILGAAENNARFDGTRCRGASTR